MIYAQRKPFQSNEERLVSEALAASQEPADVIAAIRPPLPQIELFPPRYGYPTVQQRALNVSDVVGVHQVYPDARSQTSGGIRDISGSSRNVSAPSNTGF